MEPTPTSLDDPDAMVWAHNDAQMFAQSLEQKRQRAVLFKKGYGRSVAWSLFDPVHGSKDGAGRYKAQCRWCDSVIGFKVESMFSHVINHCPACPQDHRDLLKLKRLSSADDSLNGCQEKMAKRKLQNDLVEIFAAADISLSLLDQPILRNFCTDVSKGWFTVPSRATVSARLLPIHASRIENDSRASLAEQDNLVVAFDGWTCGPASSIYAFSVSTPTFSTLIDLVEMSGTIHDAESIGKILLERLKVAGIEPKKIGSIMTDNCSTMLAVRADFCARAGLKHVINVDCVLHRLHILIKAIIEAEPASEIFKSACKIVGSLCHSSWYLVFLAVIRYLAEKGRGLMTFARTRWASAALVLRSVAENREGLAFIPTMTEGPKLSAGLRRLLEDKHLMLDIEILLKVIEPIYATILRLEGERIGLVDAWFEVSRLGCQLQRVELGRSMAGFMPLVIKAYNDAHDKIIKRHVLFAASVDPGFRTLFDKVPEVRSQVRAYLADQLQALGGLSLHKARGVMAAYDMFLRSQGVYYDVPLMMEAVAFWSKVRSSVRDKSTILLATICLRHLAARASTAHVERLFSKLRCTTRYNRNRLTVQSIKELTMIKLKVQADPAKWIIRAKKKRDLGGALNSITPDSSRRSKRHRTIAEMTPLAQRHLNPSKSAFVAGERAAHEIMRERGGSLQDADQDERDVDREDEHSEADDAEGIEAPLESQAVEVDDVPSVWTQAVFPAARTAGIADPGIYVLDDGHQMPPIKAAFQIRNGNRVTRRLAPEIADEYAAFVTRNAQNGDDASKLVVDGLLGLSLHESDNGHEDREEAVDATQALEDEREVAHILEEINHSAVSREVWVRPLSIYGQTHCQKYFTVQSRDQIVTAIDSSDEDDRDQVGEDTDAWTVGDILSV